MHYMFFAHIMHTWSPSYNQTLPSIYQTVNGLINSYVDKIYIHTHTHTFLICTHLFVQCTQSTALCYFSGWFCLQTRGNHTFLQLISQNAQAEPLYNFAGDVIIFCLV